MSELALYRKYRPKTFAEVVGQDEVLAVLEPALRDQEPAHAYLFIGSRGTGKTSVARLVAAKLKTEPVDLYEIDAASNRGIDEIRALREAVKSLPFASPYKVYIIDEVHMLTKEAFNALLKTLEEPPAHVIFILATTEIQRVPETIVSRCQVLTFRPPTLEILKKHLTRVSKAEGYAIEPAAVELVALAGDGSYRDALGALQKAMAISPDKKIAADEVARVLGAPRRALVEQILSAVASKDASGVSEAVMAAESSGVDLRLVLGVLLTEVRLALRGVLAGKKDQLMPMLAALEPKRLAEILRLLLGAHDEVTRGPLPSLALELALLQLTGVNE